MLDFPRTRDFHACTLSHSYLQPMLRRSRCDRSSGFNDRVWLQVACTLVLDVKHASGLNRRDISMQPQRDVWYDDVIPSQPSTCDPEWVPAEHPLFLLYTSGSTGKPKGVQHSTAGYMVYIAATCKYVFNMAPGDVFWCTADCGWITGHSYLTYGPLLNGVASVVFEGVPSYPDVGRFWEVVAKYKVKQFYTAPTAIRALMSHGDEPVRRHDRSSLEVSRCCCMQI
jgi:acetyl-CoA synthetase